MNIVKRIIGSIFIILAFCSCNPNKEISLKSPDSKYNFNLDLDEGLSYSINWNGTNIMESSSLGFKFSDGFVLGDDVVVESVKKSTHDSEWKPVYGERNVYLNSYNETLVHLSCKEWSGKLALRIRAYNEGVTFRYEIISDKDLEVDKELTEFVYSTNPTIWSSKAAQSEIHEQKLSELKYIAERPLLAELSDSVFTAIGEAALVDFARMKFEKHASKSNTLVASLEKGKNKEYPIVIPANGYNTPWRYIMAGKTAGEILQNNYLLLNLNEENQIENTSYIKPGKVIREISLTTQGGIACVDFAVKHKLQYIEFDAGWYGNEYDSASDATTITVDSRRSPGPLDLKHVIDYAKERGIGVIVYVNRRALEKQLDEILPLYKSWGIAGVKYGFVNVGPQKWTAWLHDAVKKAAEYELMIDTHDEYRPTGFSRTYPNFMTQEGIRGDEESTPNAGVINTIFTRSVAGAADQTYCYFADRVENKMGSHASQMAKAVCIYSPWQFLYWYDRPADSPLKKGSGGGTKGVIQEIEDLQFFDELPTVWDDTKVLEGYPGKYVSIAREKGDQWFLGALAGIEAYDLNLKLDFLEANKKYQATIYSDDKSLNKATNVRIQEVEVSAQTVLKQSILEQNGLAVIFTPIN
ncbi:glycoside hydrolase family 97 N-terminal domain-containing protein [uncultured Draconibacterium sp.]|uniref:glycoside hydrolase family 97 protein n=1 Tax=uncultured Draconibacterium sp. TaxID=1573823 RepID=UPI00326166AA